MCIYVYRFIENELIVRLSTHMLMLDPESPCSKPRYVREELILTNGTKYFLKKREQKEKQTNR